MSGVEEAKEDLLSSLKKDWLEDPCWDIEDTDGFEDFRDELRNFRLETQAKWDTERAEKAESERNRRLERYETLGPDGLMALLEKLESGLSEAQSQISGLTNEVKMLRSRRG